MAKGSDITVKPTVIVNMAMSADGKISSRRRETFPLGSAEDRRLMDVLRARADAVIIGANIVRLDGYAIRVRNKDLRDRRKRERGNAHPLNVVLTTTLDLPLGAQFFTHPRTPRLVVTTRQAPKARVERARRVADVEVLPRRRIDPQRVVDLLAARGCRHLLLEGGGELNYSFFERGLVDELFITVTPRILGGRDAPTVVDGKGFLAADHPDLNLVSCRRRGDEVFLRYRVERDGE